MNALAVQNPRHKCDQEKITIITDKKIIADNTDLTVVIIIMILRLYYICVCICVCVIYNLHSIPVLHNSQYRNSALIKIKQTTVTCMKLNRWSQNMTVRHGRKLRASLMLQQPLIQLYLISSCDSTVIAFKQDKMCFHVLYQMSSESDEMAIMSCKNCHNFITKRCVKRPVFYFDPCIISHLMVAQTKSQCCQLSRNLFIHRQTEHLTFCSPYVVEG